MSRYTGYVGYVKQKKGPARAAVRSWCDRQLCRLLQKAGRSDYRARHAAGPDRAAAESVQRGRAGGEGLVAETGPGDGSVVGGELQTTSHLPPAPGGARGGAQQ